MRNIIGVDLGGTSIEVGLIQDSKIVQKISSPTYASEGGNVTLNALKRLIEQVLSPECVAIGIGVPSVVDRIHGIAYDFQNIANWQEVHLKQILEAEFGLPVIVDNDANCFALGERFFGKGRNLENFVGVTLGTGLGGGIIYKGKLLQDSNCGSGEFGELFYKDSKFEDYCGSRFFLNHYNKTGKELAESARKGENDGLDAFSQYGLHLANLVKTIMYVYDPEAVIFGGSISKSYDLFEHSLKRNLSDFAYSRSLKNISIMASDAPNNGILGAAALCLDL